ncbi:alpha/beta hydrolase [Variovorax sp. PBS-H4]|uniref:alpha/beta hydrolase n=1 Tax=Variovorax sp. PBS-H4 TaxID=434008 RepID=UPI0013A56B86|nr:carboxylesterase family protein [Variovorax sp. PBS-H4]
MTDLGGDLTALAEQVERSIAWVSRHASTFGGDARRIHLSGHSSGAHLLGVALTRDWKARNCVDPRTLRSALLLSGIYDLEPVSLSERSRHVQLGDPDVVSDLSPVRNARTFACPVVVGYGSLDMPEYQHQSKAFVDELKSSGKQAALLKADFYNHFEQLETLGNPLGTFGRVALGQIASHHS